MSGKLGVFQLLGKRMDWLSQRQRVLADNIANSDTPDFVPRDIKESQFLRILRSRVEPVETQATHARHMQGRAVKGGPARREAQNETYETSPSGNAVVLEEQMIKVSKTQTDYQTMTNLYRKHMQMFMTALRGG